VKALDAYLGPPSDDEITARLDDVYATVPSNLDAELLNAQLNSIGDTW